MQNRKDHWTVGDWMTPNPRTIPPTHSARTAFIEMRNQGFRHLIVSENRKMLGIVTDRDLRRPDISDQPEGWHEFYQPDDDYQVRDVMTEKVVTLTVQDQLERALKLFIDNKFGALPVLDKKGDLVGILTNHDINRAFAEVLKDYGKVLRK